MLKNAKSSGASASVATDGERLYINFATDGKVVLSALSLEVVSLATNVCNYQIHQGYGASPALYESWFIVWPTPKVEERSLLMNALLEN